MLDNKFKTYKVRLNFANAKSQSAMEFLMTYGWAFLIVLIVIFSLIYFGVLDPDVFLPEKVDLQEGVSIVDASADENSISFILRNTLGRDIHDFQLNATECNDGNGTLSTAVDIPEGKTRKITIYCEHDYAVGSKIDSELDATWKTRISTKGERYDFDHVTTGTMKVTVNEGKELYDRVAVTDCGNFTLNRTYYFLTQDIIVGGTCFDIQSDNVIIDLNGYTISGPNTTVSFGVLLNNSNNATVTGGTVSGFKAGVLSSFGANNTVHNITALQNVMYGVQILSSSGNKVYNITSISNSRDGVYFYNSSDNEAYDLKCYNNSRYGLYLWIGNNTYVHDSELDYNDDAGLYMEGWTNSFHHIIEDVSTSNNNGSGISSFSVNISYININSSQNGNYGLFTQIGNDTRIINSTFYNNTGNGLGLYAFYTNINLTNVNVSLSGGFDLYLNSLSYSQVNCLNCSYNSSKEKDDSGILLRKWYYKTYVNDTDGNAVSGAYVAGYNVSGDLIFNVTTGADGWTPNAEIIEYANNSGTTSYYSNYTINVTKWGIVNTTTGYNVSLLGNKFDNNLVINNLWCYQESANLTTSCGGFDNGSYAWTLGYVNWPAEIIDGNWTTYDNDVDSSMVYAYMNYSIPSGADVSNSYLQAKHMNTTNEIPQVVVTLNYSIYSDCIGDKLQFRVGVDGAPAGGAFDCYNTSSSSWKRIFWIGGGAYEHSPDVYEEAMWWYIP